MGLPNIGPIELIIFMAIAVVPILLIVLLVRRPPSNPVGMAPPAAVGPPCPRCTRPTVIGASFCGTCGQSLSGG